MVEFKMGSKWSCFYSGTHPDFSDLDIERVTKLGNSNPMQSVIKIQATWRGYTARKLKIFETLDSSNSLIKATELRLGQFNHPKGKFRPHRPYRYDNESVYWGEIGKDKIRQGRGVQVWTDGTKYEGRWENNMANGRGRLIHSDGSAYEGDWVDDKAHGCGTYWRTDGAKYEGEWEADMQHGFGVETWPDGSQYTGQYVMGKKQGQGEFSWADGSSYKGEFSDDFLDGEGIYTLADGRSQSSTLKATWRSMLNATFAL